VNPPPVFSQRFLRKGPLVEETYRLFAGWRFEDGVEENLKNGLHGQFKTLGWEKEVVSTVKSRLKNFALAKPLIVLARGGVAFADWRDCWRLYIGASEQPFGSFATGWLYSEYASGRYQLTSEDARDFAKSAWTRHSPKRPLSEHGVVRLARDLVKTASDLGMLAGKGTKRTFAPIAMSDHVILFYAHLIAEIEGAATKVEGSPLWRLAYMSPADVHTALLRLHQFKRLDYQVAGSLIQLGLPGSSTLAYAESIAK
jgi:hypothetical protein